MQDTMKQTECTLIIKISHPKESNWRGKVTLAETRQERSFESAMELIHLVSHAVNDMDLG